MCGGPISSNKKTEADYRAEDDLRTLTRAEEVRRDPKRVAVVGRMRDQQVKVLKRVVTGKARGRKR